VPSSAAQNGKSASQASVQPAVKASLVVRRAIYGDLPDGTTADVTDKVRTMARYGALSVLATDDNFGDPYKGAMKLTIVRAEIRVPYLNLGGEGGAVDITDKIKPFQSGNRLTAKMGGSGKVTVYYKYGEGKTLSREQADDGSIMIAPPTKLRVDYSLNGKKMSKTVALTIGWRSMLRANDREDKGEASRKGPP
jgi:hypothetical protein